MSAAVSSERFARGAEAAPCECGGYADRVEATPDEIAEHGCGRASECCARAFVCRKCGTRIVGTAEAPEMDS